MHRFMTAAAVAALIAMPALAQQNSNTAPGYNNSANATNNQTNTYNITNSFNQLLATAQGNLQTIENTAGQVEATQAGGVATTQATATTQFAGSGLVVNVYGNTADANEIGSEVSWALRSNIS